MLQPGARWLIFWLPFAVACSELTRPAPDRASAPAADAPAPAASAAGSAAALPKLPPAIAGADSAEISASHILIAYRGSTRGRATATRTKEEARKRADDLLARLRDGADFAELARAESDSPSAPRGGDLGSFTSKRMEPIFAAAAFALAPGETSGVVETPFGFHIIKRTK
jgi:peptidyl-prolyl cis-trans isomerase C/peptidyl-prolyl cis-trans isomerase SurA